MKEIILLEVKDTVYRLMYEHRKEDEELPRGAIEQAIKDGIITVDEIVNTFKEELIKGL